MTVSGTNPTTVRQAFDLESQKLEDIFDTSHLNDIEYSPKQQPTTKCNGFFSYINSVKNYVMSDGPEGLRNDMSPKGQMIKGGVILVGAAGISVIAGGVVFGVASYSTTFASVMKTVGDLAVGGFTILGLSGQSGEVVSENMGSQLQLVSGRHLLSTNSTICNIQWQELDNLGYVDGKNCTKQSDMNKWVPEYDQEFCEQYNDDQCKSARGLKLEDCEDFNSQDGGLVVCKQRGFGSGNSDVKLNTTTLTPTLHPTNLPSPSPTTGRPTVNPITPPPTHKNDTKSPTWSPTTGQPTLYPSFLPTMLPTLQPTVLIHCSFFDNSTGIAYQLTSACWPGECINGDLNILLALRACDINDRTLAVSEGCIQKDHNDQQDGVTYCLVDDTTPSPTMDQNLTFNETDVSDSSEEISTTQFFFSTTGNDSNDSVSFAIPSTSEESNSDNDDGLSNVALGVIIGVGSTVACCLSIAGCALVKIFCCKKNDTVVDHSSNQSSNNSGNIVEVQRLVVNSDQNQNISKSDKEDSA